MKRDCNKVTVPAPLQVDILISLPFLQSLLDLPLRGFGLQVLTLVIVVLAAGQRDFELGPAMLKIYLERDNREALLARLAEQLDDFSLVHEQPTGPQRVMIEDVALLIGTDVHVLDEYLTVLYRAVAVLEIGPSGPQGLDLGSLQFYAGLIGIMDEIVMPGFAVLAGNLDADILFSHRPSPCRFQMYVLPLARCHLLLFVPPSVLR